MLDAANISGLGPSESHESTVGGWQLTKGLGLKCKVLDLSRNLLNDWDYVCGIGSAAGGDTLHTLKLEYVS